MRRLFAIPFLSALLGAGVAVAVIAAFGGLDNTEHVTTTIQAAPLQPSNASQQTPKLTPHDIYMRDAPGVVFVTSTIVQKTESPFGLFGGGEAQQRGQATGSGIVGVVKGLTVVVPSQVGADASKLTTLGGWKSVWPFFGS